MIAMFDISFVKSSMFAVMVAGMTIIGAVSLVAIAAKRPRLAARLGGGVLLAVGIAAVLIPALKGAGGGFAIPEWGATLLLLALPIAALAALGSALAGKPNGQRTRMGWLPVLMLLVALTVSSFVFLRYLAGRKSAMQTAEDAGQMAIQQAQIAHQMAEMTASLEQRIANMNIHELMDRVDAPRIAIPPDAPSPPQAPEETTVATRNEATGEVGNDAKTGGGGASSEEAGNEGSNADSKQVDSEKDAIDGDTQTENAEESKPDSIDTPEELKSGNKPDSESADKASDTAEEEQVNDPPTAVAAEEPKKSIRSDAPKSDEELTISTIDSAAEPAAQRPDWVSAQPKRVGEVQQEVIVTDEWSTEAECERARDIGLMLKTYEHIQAMFGVPYQRQASDHRMNSDDAWNDQRLHQLASAGIMLDFARREIAKEEHVETVQRSFGPMKKLYTLVAFSPAVDRELRHKWEAYQRQERFAMVGIGAGSILGLVGLAYGLLKADTLTKGYYSKRLFIGVPAAIISTLALLALMNS